MPRPDPNTSRRQWEDSQGHRDRRDEQRRDRDRLTVPSERVTRRGR